MNSQTIQILMCLNTTQTVYKIFPNLCEISNAPLVPSTLLGYTSANIWLTTFTWAIE